MHLFILQKLPQNLIMLLSLQEIELLFSLKPFTEWAKSLWSIKYSIKHKMVFQNSL